MPRGRHVSGVVSVGRDRSPPLSLLHYVVSSSVAEVPGMRRVRVKACGLLIKRPHCISGNRLQCVYCAEDYQSDLISNAYIALMERIL